MYPETTVLPRKLVIITTVEVKIIKRGQCNKVLSPFFLLLRKTQKMSFFSKLEIIISYITDSVDNICWRTLILSGVASIKVNLIANTETKLNYSEFHRTRKGLKANSDGMFSIYVFCAY